ncbi:MAG: hypothetical protein HYS23_14900 [Geobacter sp.]|nr:hypothetical protein [Geobacter sp.]
MPDTKRIPPHEPPKNALPATTPSYPSPFALTLIVGFSVFFVELLIMVTLHVMRFPPVAETIVDSVVLTLLVIPVLYFFIYRPMARHIHTLQLIRADRERLIAELQDADEQVKTLSGLLPICAWCKKIRDPEGKWNEIEEYVQHHTDADFTHSICPECRKRNFPTSL